MPKHKFTQEDINGRVIAGTHHVDEVNIINELRKILEDLAVIVGQAKLGDGNYPADGTTGIVSTYDFANNIVKNNFEAYDLPTAEDDETSGYSKGSIWVYGGEAYICVDATFNSADWKGITNTEYIS